MTTPTRQQVQAMIEELREHTCARKLEHAAAMLEALMPNDQPDATPCEPSIGTGSQEAAGPASAPLPIIDMNESVLRCPKCGSMEVMVTLPNADFTLQWMPKNDPR